MKKDNDYSSNFSLKLYRLCQRMPWLRKMKVLLYFFDTILLLFIKKPKKNKLLKKRIFIMFNYAFGDGIIWLTAASNLRNLYPKNEYDITLMCQRGLNQIYENSKIFDSVVPYNLTEATFNLRKRVELYKVLRQKYYDIVIDPIGVSECTTNIFMSRALCADEKISILDITNNNQLCPKWLYKKIYTKIIIIDKPNISLVEYYHELLKNLGLNDKIVLKKKAYANLKIKLPNQYYIVFPSASTELKRWPLKNYAKIIEKIYKKTKMPLVLCGTEKDKNTYDELVKLIPNIPYIDIIGETSLLEFIEVVKKAKFVVTNDTSTYHIAVVNEIPVAIITGGYTYDRYVAYRFTGCDNYKKPYIIVKNNKCFNCDNVCNRLTKSDKIWPCLNDINVIYAWNIIKKMIDKEM